jgi:hypothetical protein
MRWFIFVVALLLDPLAVVLLFAANAPDQNAMESATAESQKPNRNEVSQSSAYLASNPKQDRAPFWWSRFGPYAFNLSPYGSGRSAHSVKAKNPKGAATREAQEHWGP